MKRDQQAYDRRSIRLRGFDYRREGPYFVTICTSDREQLFGEIVGGVLRGNRLGEIVRKEWCRSEELRSEVVLDEFIVMPNHVHGIVFLDQHVSTATHRNVEDRVGAHGNAPSPVASRRPKSLSTFVSGFKASTARQINNVRGTPGAQVWQRNYHDRIIRDDAELDRIRAYIAANPENWRNDEYYT
jgi:REP element-mobilizing transposase RayT